jgi:MFS family permease
LKFYPPGNDTFAYIAYLATFAVGFVVRPFGALFFGRIGDLVGRKYAFLVTLSVMGLSTCAIGLMPSYATAGWVAPVLLSGTALDAPGHELLIAQRHHRIDLGSATRRQQTRGNRQADQD